MEIAWNNLCLFDTSLKPISCYKKEDLRFIQRIIKTNPRFAAVKLSTELEEEIVIRVIRAYGAIAEQPVENPSLIRERKICV